MQLKQGRLINVINGGLKLSGWRPLGETGTEPVKQLSCEGSGNG